MTLLGTAHVSRASVDKVREPLQNGEYDASDSDSSRVWWRSCSPARRSCEEEIEHLKEGDVLESIFAEFARDRRDLYVPLIDERDRYLAARLREEIAGKHHGKVLAVLGALHLKGVAGYLRRGRDGTRGPRSPTSTGCCHPKRWPKLIPWLIAVLILWASAMVSTRVQGSVCGWCRTGCSSVAAFLAAP